MDFTQFVDGKISDRGLSVFEFERLTGNRFRDVKQGKQKPPIVDLVKWADVLELNEADRLRMLILANEAHGGGTIAGWIVDEINRLRAQATERDHLIAELALEVQKLKKVQEKT
jgi:hypothetical protein